MDEEDGGNPVERRQEEQERESALAREAGAEPAKELGAALASRVEHFLQAFEATAPAAEWELWTQGRLRTKPDASGWRQCPLQFMAGPDVYSTSLAYVALGWAGYGPDSPPVIWQSADDLRDSLDFDPSVRARLLRAAGLA